MQKTIIKLVLATTLLVGISATGLTNDVEAKTETKKLIKTEIKAKKYKSNYKKESTYAKKYPETYKMFEKDILKHNTTIYWKRSEFKKIKVANYSDEFIKLMDEVEVNNPTKVVDSNRGFRGIKYFTYFETSNVDKSKMVVEYRLKKATKDKYVSAVNKKVESIAYKIAKPSDSDYKKVKAVHDYVVKNITYDYRTRTNNEPDVSHLSYGGLILKVGVCDAYAKSMKDLLTFMGVETGVMFGTGNGEAHSWNYVKIDGKTYYIDATWNDTAKSNKYFLVNTKQLQKDHKWDKKLYPVSTSTKYVKK